MLLLLGLSLLLGSSVPVAADTAAKRPHILLVLADDLGFGNVGWNRKAYDCETDEVQTPRLDALVAEGVEMQRFYAYHMCSPTRSALQTGRHPMHVNIENSNPTIYNASESTGTGAGIPRNMTGIAAKLRTAGYRAHMVGKWDAGMATPDHTPTGRGYESSLGYFHHGNSYWKLETGDLNCQTGADIWDTDHPAHELVPQGKRISVYNESAYEEAMFMERMADILDDYTPAADEPLFLFYAAHLVHDPLEVPQQYLDRMSKATGGPFDNATDNDNTRMAYHAMAYYLDEQVGRLVDKFKAKGMWEDTLMLFVSDNGGPIYGGGNNYPLRGGKYSEFEGGVRVAAFASGGAIPKKQQGSRVSGLGAIADVYATLCGIAGVDATDHFADAAGLPAVDGLDISPMLLGTGPSPRTEVPLAPMSWSDINKLDEYDAMLAALHMANRVAAMAAKQGTCNSEKDISYGGKNISAHKNVPSNACCGLCNSTKGCAAGVWQKTDSHSGTCWLKESHAEPIVAKGHLAFVATSVPPLPPVIDHQAGLVVGDMKIVVGVSINQAVFTGPQYPNASTPWTQNNVMKVPEFGCSTAAKPGCLFNVTADPTEHHDLALEQPEIFAAMLGRLRNLSKTRFDPMRGEGDSRACVQMKKNANEAGLGFFGPWLDLP